MKILFAAGGTGGHINPALAVAGVVRERYPDAEILFVGTKDKMESRLVPAAGFDFTTIKISGFQRKISIVNIFRNLLTIWYLLTCNGRVKKIPYCFDILYDIFGSKLTLKARDFDCSKIKACLGYES